MKSAGAIRAGRAFVELFADDSKMSRDLKRARGKLQTFSKAANAIGVRMAGMGGLMAAPLLSFIDAAGKAQERAQKLDAVFGKSAASARKFAKETADAIGRFSGDLETAMSTFQSFLVGGGFEAPDAEKLTQKLTRLGLDLAAFHDVSDDDAFGRLVAAMSGSSEVLDQFGINIKQAALDQELLNQGFEGGVAKATEYQKTLARVALIEKALQQQGAIGTAERESGSYANQIKALTGRFKELKETLGSELLPVATEWLNKGNQLASDAIGWIRQNEDLVNVYGKTTVALVAGGGAFLTAGHAVNIMSGAIGGFLTAGKAAASVMTFVNAQLAAMKVRALTTAASVRALTVAAGAAKLALAGMVAVGVFKLTQELTGAADAQRKLNAEIEKGRKLQQDIDNQSRRRRERRDEAIENAKSPREKQKLLQTELDSERANQVGLIGQEKRAQDALGRARMDDLRRGGPTGPLGISFLGPTITHLLGPSEETKRIESELNEIQEKRRLNTARVNRLDADLKEVERQIKPEKPDEPVSKETVDHRPSPENQPGMESLRELPDKFLSAAAMLDRITNKIGHATKAATITSAAGLLPTIVSAASSLADPSTAKPNASDPYAKVAELKQKFAGHGAANEEQAMEQRRQRFAAIGNQLTTRQVALSSAGAFGSLAAQNLQLNRTVEQSEFTNVKLDYESREFLRQIRDLLEGDSI